MATPDKDAPQTKWLAGLIQDECERKPLKEARILRCPADDEYWASHCASHVWIIPLDAPDYQWCGLLILSRNESWNEAEQVIASHAADAYAHALAKQHQIHTPPLWKRLLQSKKRRYALLGIALLLLLPLRLSVIAPAEVIASKPALIRASMNGVVKEIMVQPGEHVGKEQPLVQFDEEELQNRINVARKALDVATLDHRQMLQAGLDDQDARADIIRAAGTMKKAKTELAFAESLLARTIITAPDEGVVIFEDVYDWVGRPVSIGERIMLLANPADSQLEIRVSVHDAIHLPEQADIQFFSNVSPHMPQDATLNYHSYRATETEDGSMSYRLKADWADAADAPMLGLKGSAKLYGERAPLIMHILRKPLTIIRQWLGM